MPNNDLEKLYSLIEHTVKAPFVILTSLLEMFNICVQSTANFHFTITYTVHAHIVIWSLDQQSMIIVYNKVDILPFP